MHQTAAEIVRIAAQKHWRICCVESVSGGRIASALTAISGSSNVFYAGGVFYDVEAKIRFLDIPETFFKKFSVYSEECATKMAKNWREKCDADFCVSTTGEAEGENSGRVFLGISAKRKTESFVKVFAGNRQDVQGQARDFALELLKKALIGH